MIAKDQTWINKESGEPVLILRVDKIYITYQNKAGDVGNRHPIIFLQDFESHSVVIDKRESKLMDWVDFEEQGYETANASDI